jgi:hypothetical protein
LSVEKKERRRWSMEKREVVEMLKQAVAKIKEADDLLVRVELWLMDKEKHNYASIAEGAGYYLYRALKEIKELFDIEDMEELE